MLGVGGQRELVGQVDVLPGLLPGRQDRILYEEDGVEVPERRGDEQRDCPGPCRRHLCVPAGAPVPTQRRHGGERHDDQERPQDDVVLQPWRRERPPGHDLECQTDGGSVGEVFDEGVRLRPAGPEDQRPRNHDAVDDVERVAADVHDGRTGDEEDDAGGRQDRGQGKPAIEPAPRLDRRRSGYVTLRSHASGPELLRSVGVLRHRRPPWRRLTKSETGQRPAIE